MTFSAGSTTHSLAIGRLIRAPVPTVFDAWLQPGLMRLWLKPRPEIQTDVEADPNVGGALRVVMRMGSHVEVHEGAYLLIERPDRLRFTWVSEAAGPHSAIDISFLASHGGHTMLLLKHHGLKDRLAESNHREGWRRILDRLSEFVENGPKPSN